MFDKIKAIFETYSRSSDFHSDKTLRTIYVKKSSKMVANDIIEILKSLKYKEIVYNDTFNELFTSKAGFEVTIHLALGNNGTTGIEVAVFSPQNRGKTRKALRFLLNKFSTEFSNYLVHE